MKQLLLQQGTLATVNRIYRTDILIEEGKIKSINEKIIPTSGMNLINVEEYLILPGLIDAHVHCRDPGFPEKEDFYSASLAAIAGGVTTIIDMPNTQPPTFTMQALQEKRKLAAKARCNVLFHFGTDGNNLNEIRKAEQEHDVVSTKLYMNITTGKYLIEDQQKLENIFKASKFLSIHAERDQLKIALDLAVRHQRRVYICHNSAEEDMEEIKQARQQHKKIFAEVTPHHLFLTDEDEKEQGAFCMMKPSLKKEADQKAVWKALQQGHIDTIATDHAPHTAAEKRSAAPPFGVPGLETMLPLLLNAVNKKKMSLQQLVQLTAANPAAIFGVKNKGKIEIGYDADLVIVDMQKKKRVNNAKLYTRCGWSPFHGRELQGWPLMTVIDGEIVWRE